MRTKNAIRNAAFAFGGQFLSIVLSFVTRTFFVYSLGVTYLGVNGLFTNVLTVLSFAELGVGTAIIYALYKPFAANDEYKTCALMNFYAKAYRIIGLVITLLGLTILPFLDYLIKDKTDIPQLSIIYILFLINSVASYFFAFKRSIILVSQNGHINTINQSVFLILQNIIQILILILTNNYLLYLVTQILCGILSNYAISIKADKMFPYLKMNRNILLDFSSRKSIYKNVLAMMSNKVGSAIVSGTGNLLLSAFVGITWVGLYSNYQLITSTITLLLMQIFNAINPSIGNLNALENKEKSYSSFQTLFLINIWVFGFVTISLTTLLNPFILLWLGDKYLLENSVVSIIVLNFFLYGLRQIAIIFVNTYGLFWQIKYKSLVEAMINLLASLYFLLVLDMGILGILLGTTVSTLLTNFWWEPFVVYKYGFNRNVAIYYKRCGLFVLVVVINLMITVWICNHINISNPFSWILRGIVCFIVSNGLFLFAFFKTREFGDIFKIIKEYIIKPLKERIFLYYT